MVLRCALDSPPSDGLNVTSSKPWNIIHLLACRTPCRFVIHSNFLGPYGLESLEWTWSVSGFATDHTTWISWGQGPSNSSVKWPLLLLKKSQLILPNWRMLKIHNSIFLDAQFEVLFSHFSMTRLGNTKKVVLLRCCLLINMTNGIKLSYFCGNTKT